MIILLIIIWPIYYGHHWDSLITKLSPVNNVTVTIEDAYCLKWPFGYSQVHFISTVCLLNLYNQERIIKKAKVNFSHPCNMRSWYNIFMYLTTMQMVETQLMYSNTSLFLYSLSLCLLLSGWYCWWSSSSSFKEHSLTNGRILPSTGIIECIVRTV